MQSLSVAKVLIDRKIIFKTRQVASFERWTGKDRKTKNLAISTPKNRQPSKSLSISEGGGLKSSENKNPSQIFNSSFVAADGGGLGCRLILHFYYIVILAVLPMV